MLIKQSWCFTALDPNAVPDIYESKVYASQDYENNGEGGLSFTRGTPVYVLLRNEGGWCTGR